MIEELHAQVAMWFGEKSSTHLPVEFTVDAKMSKIIGWCNSRSYRTFGSCENYGEYLRSLGMDFNHESTRDYAYIEFMELEDAIMFMQDIQDRAGIVSGLYAKIEAEGTPDAWELKLRLTSGRFWLWFPTSDIPLIEHAIVR